MGSWCLQNRGTVERRKQMSVCETGICFFCVFCYRQFFCYWIGKHSDASQNHKEILWNRRKTGHNHKKVKKFLWKKKYNLHKLFLGHPIIKTS